MHAEWRPVPGFPGYAVTARGTVRGPRGAVLKESRSDSGYRRVRPLVRGRQRSLLVHVAVLLAHVGPRPSRRHHGAHVNGDKDDCSVGNLAWKTRRRNEADKRAHGTAPRGFSGYRPDADLVARVRALVSAGGSYSAVARELGLHRSSVSRIARELRHPIERTGGSR